MANPRFANPFRPGAGHMPPYLAGRNAEQTEFRKLLEQDAILENLVLTGLRGVGKTVLLETLKPIAVQAGWLWVGTDLSESSSTTEEHLATRLLTDLSVVTSSWILTTQEVRRFGFSRATDSEDIRLDYETLQTIYTQTPGLVPDKIKQVLETVWMGVQAQDKRGIIFAYDEAQLLADHGRDKQYPLSVLLDVFQSIQRKGVRFMLVLTGLPTLFPKLVEARTYAERMFRVVFLNRLDAKASAAAIRHPTEKKECSVRFTDDSIAVVVETSGGYPYFIQFICKEIYDVWVQATDAGASLPSIPMEAITRKLDNDFFAGRWARATDRQRDLLYVAAMLDDCEEEFTVQEIVGKSEEILDNPFGNSHANQMLSALCGHGLIYKNRHGKYSFAVPLFSRFIRRQIA
jgi:hypothetical protein